MARPPPRMFVDASLGSGDAVPLERELTHYLTRVLRLGEGDSVLVFNGRDGEWSAAIETITKRAAVLRVGAQSRPMALGPDVTLLFVPVKKAPTEFLIQKATELGVRRLQPVVSARMAERGTPARWPMIATEAAEQSERLSIPEIGELRPLFDVLDDLGDAPLMFADEAGDDAEARWGGDIGRGASASVALGSYQDAPVRPWSILVGPAGGFTPDERARLRALPQVVPVSLGPRILKAETAGLVALTLWQSVLGDL